MTIKITSHLYQTCAKHQKQRVSTALLLQAADEIARLGRSSSEVSNVNFDVEVERTVPARERDDVPEARDTSRDSCPIIGSPDFEHLTSDDGATKRIRGLLW